MRGGRCSPKEKLRGGAAEESSCPLRATAPGMGAADAWSANASVRTEMKARAAKKVMVLQCMRCRGYGYVLLVRRLQGEEMRLVSK